jgi:hypothetical protein
MIRRRGNSWIVQVYVGQDAEGRKKYRSRSLPAGTEKKPSKASRDLEVAMKTEVARGEVVTAYVTVSELMDTWIAQEGPTWSPWTLRGYRSKIDLYILPALGNVKLTNLATVRIDALYASMRDRGLSPATIRQTHAILRKALDRARRWRWIVRNPAEDATAPRVIPTEICPPTRNDVEALRAAADPDLADAILLAAHTGARRGELCGLTWADINLETGRMTIRRSVVDLDGKTLLKPTKTNRARNIVIGPTVVEMLRRRKAAQEDRSAAFEVNADPAGFVLSETPDSSLPLRPTLLTGRYSNLCRRTGIKTRFHDLRHANATELLAAGIPATDVAQRLGHVSTKMTLDVYGHASENRAAALVFEPPTAQI